MEHETSWGIAGPAHMGCSTNENASNTLQIHPRTPRKVPVDHMNPSSPVLGGEKNKSLA